MLTPLGRITPVYIRTWSLTDKYHYFAAVIPCYADIISTQSVLYSVLPGIYKNCIMQFFLAGLQRAMADESIWWCVPVYFTGTTH